MSSWLTVMLGGEAWEEETGVAGGVAWVGLFPSLLPWSFAAFWHHSHSAALLCHVHLPCHSDVEPGDYGLKPLQTEPKYIFPHLSYGCQVFCPSSGKWLMHFPCCVSLFLKSVRNTPFSVAFFPRVLFNLEGGQLEYWAIFWRNFMIHFLDS